jgi:voltage-gated potassium channel
MPEPIADVQLDVPSPGAPRNDQAAASLAVYDRRARLPIVLSALVPLVIAPEPGNPVSVVIGIVSWLVFVVDFVVHERLLRQYLRTGLGRFDLAIVVLTAPWFLLPGTHAVGGFIVVLRLARLARLVVANRPARQLFSRLGRVAVVALSVMVGGALVAFYAEHAVNPEFANFGDSLWWSIVTLTTVGYGDIVPVTLTGRTAAVMIMLTGVAVLGLLAGSLASFFRLQPGGSDNAQQSADAERPSPVAPNPAPPLQSMGPGLDQVLGELAELKAQIASLSADLARSERKQV